MIHNWHLEKHVTDLARQRTAQARQYRTARLARGAAGQHCHGRPTRGQVRPDAEAPPAPALAWAG